jgi:hypothetical protein
MSERDSLDMSTDNTAEGEMYSDTVVSGPITEIRIGDKVVDSTGKEVGKVKFVKMGDPNAVTTAGQWGYSADFLGLSGDDYDIGQLPEQARGQLMRVGFIHIDIPWAGDKFAGAGMIDRSEGATVYLNVPESALI